MSQKIPFLTHLVARRILAGSSFTAFDITQEIRQQVGAGTNIEHKDVSDQVAELYKKGMPYTVRQSVDVGNGKSAWSYEPDRAKTLPDGITITEIGKMLEGDEDMQSKSPVTVAITGSDGTVNLSLWDSVEIDTTPKADPPKVWNRNLDVTLMDESDLSPEAAQRLVDIRAYYAQSKYVPN